MKLVIQNEVRDSRIAARDERGHLLPIEGIRGLAVFLVFFVHLHPLFANYLYVGGTSYRVSFALAALGNGGVDLFFLLSGYLIYGIVLRRPTTYGHFVWRRIRRIYPAFLSVFAVYLILSFVFSSQNKLSGSWSQQLIYVVENFFLLPGIFPISPIITVAWSLSYEFFFYLSIPLIMPLLRPMDTRQKIRLFVAWWLIGLVLLRIVDLQRIQMFVLGMLLFELSQVRWVRQRLGPKGECIALAAFVLALACAFVVFLPAAEVRSIASFARYFAYPLMSFGFLIFGLYGFIHSGFLSRLLSWRPMRSLGRISYSYYLIHGLTLKAFAMVCLVLIKRHGAALFWGIAVFGFVATCITASALFYLIEEPLSLQGESSLSKWWKRGSQELLPNILPSTPGIPHSVVSVAIGATGSDPASVYAHSMNHCERKMPSGSESKVKICAE